MDWKTNLLDEVAQIFDHESLRIEIQRTLTPIANHVINSALKNEEYQRDVERMLTPIWDKLHNLAYLFLATALVNIILTCIILAKLMFRR